MSLTEAQINQLRDAIRNYNFPAIYYDFKHQREILANNMTEVENAVGEQLRSSSAENVTHGLMNILYWGYAKVGYRDIRVEHLRKCITGKQLDDFQGLLKNGTPTMGQIKSFHIPQYSGMSFLSKILMFLDGTQYCVLDQQIARLRTNDLLKALNRLSFRPKDTQIRVSSHNESVYDDWRKECLDISRDYFNAQYRVTDIERGFFHLIQTGHLLDAQVIYTEV